MEQITKIYSERKRAGDINKEKKRLREIFKNIETNKTALIEKLIEEAAFQSVTLEETRELIKKTGVIEEYQNGANQKGVKKSSAVEVYDKMVNTYSRIIKQLCDLLPAKINFEGGKGEKDPAAEIMEYVESMKR